MTDTLGLVLFVVVCAACIADGAGASSIFHETEGRLPRRHTVLVDQGYKGWLVEFAKRWFGIVVDIVSRSPSQRERIPHSINLNIPFVFAWLPHEGARLFAGLPYAAVQLPPFPLWLLSYYAIVVGGWLSSVRQPAPAPSNPPSHTRKG